MVKTTKDHGTPDGRSGRARGGCESRHVYSDHTSSSLRLRNTDFLREFAAMKLKDAAPWKKSCDQTRQHIKKQRHYFANKGPSSQSYGFSSSHVWMWESDHIEGWVPKNLCFWTVVLGKTLESPLDCKEIQPKGDQSWIFTGRTNAKAEAPILWPPDVKNWLTGKDPDAGKDWRQKEKGMAKDEMVGWHRRLDGHEFEQALGVGDGQGSLACYSPQVGKSQTRLSDWTKGTLWAHLPHNLYSSPIKYIREWCSINYTTHLEFQNTSLYQLTISVSCRAENLRQKDPCSWETWRPETMYVKLFRLFLPPKPTVDRQKTPGLNYFWK